MKGRRLLWLALKILLSAALVGFLLHRHPPAEIRQSLAHPRWLLLGLALAVYGLSAVGGAWQWIWILRAAGIGAPAPALVRLYFVGLFFNNFLPANVGGDAVKIFDLGRSDGRPLKVFCATLLDRLLGLSSLTMLALAMVLVAVVRTTRLPPVYPLFVALLVWFGGLVLLLSRRGAGLLVPILHKVRLGAAAQKMAGVRDEFGFYRARPRWFAGLFLYAGAVQALRVGTHLVVAAGLGIALEPQQALQLFVLVPLLALLIALPISLNGIGLRETASVGLFAYAGIAAADAVAMELVAYLVMVGFSLSGGWLFLSGRRRRPAA